MESDGEETTAMRESTDIAPTLPGANAYRVEDDYFEALAPRRSLSSLTRSSSSIGNTYMTYLSKSGSISEADFSVAELDEELTTGGSLLRTKDDIVVRSYC